jgi:protoheme IX farnesyltransferase
VALPYAAGVSGPVYLAASLALTLALLHYALNVFRLRQGEAATKACKKLFGYSIIWLFLIFALVPVDRLLAALAAQG